MSSITQWTWAGSPDAEAGTLTMWPGAADELALPMQSFAAAHALAEHLQAGKHDPRSRRTRRRGRRAGDYAGRPYRAAALQAGGRNSRAHQNPQAPEDHEMSKYITILERLSPWREAYETDPAVNQAVIAAHIGCRESTVCEHIRRLGWIVPAHVRAARARVKPAPLILSGRAASSVWAWAQGVTVSTARHGGKHVEVRA